MFNSSSDERSINRIIIRGRFNSPYPRLDKISKSIMDKTSIFYP